MTEGPVSRAEFTMLAQQVSDNRRAMEHIDESGTRGVGILSAQVAEVIKDVGGLQSDFKEHLKAHEIAEQRLVSSRRWLVGAFLTGITSVAAIIALLLDIASKVH